MWGRRTECTLIRLLSLSFGERGVGAWDRLNKRFLVVRNLLLWASALFSDFVFGWRSALSSSSLKRAVNLSVLLPAIWEPIYRVESDLNVRVFSCAAQCWRLCAQYYVHPRRRNNTSPNGWYYCDGVTIHISYLKGFLKVHCVGWCPVFSPVGAPERTLKWSFEYFIVATKLSNQRRSFLSLPISMATSHSNTSTVADTKCFCNWHILYR